MERRSMRNTGLMLAVFAGWIMSALTLGPTFGANCTNLCQMMSAIYYPGGTGAHFQPTICYPDLPVCCGRRLDCIYGTASVCQKLCSCCYPSCTACNGNTETQGTCVNCTSTGDLTETYCGTPIR
jgi:hypothetical protein